VSPTRREWLREVQQAHFPTGQRIMRGTLLCLPMTTSGEVVVTDPEISEVTGLPVRTVSRHLSKAVEYGWLIRESRGGNGSRHRFRAAVPDINGVSQKWRTANTEEYATSGTRSTPQSTYSEAPGVRHLVANINKDRASVSEHVAVDQEREQRTGHDHSRVSPDRDEAKDSSDDEPTAHSPIAAISPTTIKHGRSA